MEYDYQLSTEPSEIYDSYSGSANFDPRSLWDDMVVIFRQADENTPDELPRRLYEQGWVIQWVASTASQDCGYDRLQ